MIAEERQFNLRGFLVLIGIVAIAGLALILEGLASGVLDLPLSNHAVEKSQNATTSLTPLEIQKLIDNKMCKRVEAWACEVDPHFKILCQIKGDVWGGLLVGMDGVIITGYPASYKYWTNSALRDRCVPTVWPQ